MSPIIEFRYTRLESSDDRHFVLDAWGRSYKRSQYAGIIPGKAIDKEHHYHQNQRAYNEPI